MQNVVKIINRGKKLNDANSGERDIININGYRAKKENQSEAGKITQHEKERLRKQKYRFKKSKIKCQMINMEAAAITNIADSYKTPQSL